MHKGIVFLLILFQISLANSQNELKHAVYFDTDKFEIPSTEESRLLQFIASLETNDIAAISIVGFCDDVGAQAYNLKLSQQRADAIKKVFSTQEISEDLITNVDGKGRILLQIVEEKNIEKIRGLNRKVEIIITQKPIASIETIEKTNKKPEAQEVLKGNIKVGDKIVFDTILFKMGYSDILPESKKTLDGIAAVLIERKDIYFTIQGHVCCTQNTRDAIDRKTNIKNLSEARATFIYNYFAKKGIDKKRMKHVGMRHNFPLGGDPKFDRRVEILITHVGK